MSARRIHHLGHLGFGDFVGKHATNTDAVLMNVQHDPRGLFARFVKKALKDVDHEFHGCVIVVQ